MSIAAGGSHRLAPIWRDRLAGLIVAILVTGLYSVYSAWEWWQVTVKSWDLGIFTEVVQRYAAFQAPIVPIKGEGFNLLGDHFHPLLAILAPVYWVFPHAFALVIAENVCFGLAAGLLVGPARRRLGPVAGVVVALAFGLGWGLESAVEVQFHEVALAVPLLAGCLGAYLDRRWLAAVLRAAPLVWVKEDLGTTVIVLGILIAIATKRLWPLLLSVWGLAWLAIATLVVLPLLNPNGEWAYGGTLDPIGTFTDVAKIFNEQKWETILLLLVSTAGIVWRSPLVFALLPTLAWRMLSSNYGYWGPTWHYSAVLMPIAFAALIDAVGRLRASPRRPFRAYGAVAPAIAGTAAFVLIAGLPLGTLIKADSWKPPPRGDAAVAAVAAVPAGASVESDIGLMSYLVDDHVVTWTGNENPTPDCIVTDAVAGGSGSGGASAIAAQQFPDVEFDPVYLAQGYEVVCRPNAA